MQSGQVREILVRLQHHELVAHAQLGDHRIDGTDLHTSSSTVVAKLSRRDVVGSIWHQEWQCSETRDYLLGRRRAVEPLQQLLKNEACCEDRLTTPERVRQTFDFATCLRRIPTQSQGPDRRIDEQIHSRDRSDL